MSDALLLGASLARGFTSGSVAWPLARSSALFELRYGKALVETNRRPGTVPVFGTNGQCGTHDTHLLKGPGVVCGRKGQGPLGVEWVGSDYWVIDTAYSLTPLRNDIDLKFAYYLVKYVGLNHLKDGTSNPTLSRDAFGAQLFPIPPLADQHTIADVLVALDDKIELNRRTNETLEAMARALFKSWFVDFDPVRAKAEGRTPAGMDAETAALFPSELVKSAMGRTPRAWHVESLDALAVFRNGLALQKFRPDEGVPRLPVVKIAQLRTGKADSDEWARDDISPECVIQDGDVLFSWSGSLTVVVWNGGVAALNQHLFRVTSDRVPKWFYLQWLLTHLPEFQRIAADKATTMGHIQRHHLTQALCLVPSASLLTAAGRLFAPLLDQQSVLHKQSVTLAAIRDELLPRLLSGELSADAAARSIDEVL